MLDEVQDLVYVSPVRCFALLVEGQEVLETVVIVTVVCCLLRHWRHE